jgi:3-oxoacyl-[acyl-carrier protein] reductase
MRLGGKVAIVTGASGGIGGAVARAFCREGARVVVNYRSSAKRARELCAQLESEGGEALAVRADVSKPADAKRLVASAVRAYGRLDVLANIAGFPLNRETWEYWSAPLERLTPELFLNVYKVDLWGTFNCSQAAARVMKRQGAGSIINVAANIVFSGSTEGHPFAAAKAAIVALTRDLALELGPHGIRVNALAPGSIATGWERLLSKRELREEAEVAALRRLGRPEDVAGGALFLASDESSFVTGQVLVVDGGQVLR